MEKSRFENYLEDLITPIIKRSVNQAISRIEFPKAEDNQDRILNIKEAAEFLNLAVPTLYSMTSKKSIPFFKRGKKLYFKQAELLGWIEKGKRKSKDELDREAEEYIVRKGAGNGKK